MLLTNYTVPPISQHYILFTLCIVKVIFSGGEQSRRGTAMIIRNKAIESLMYYQAISDRIILAKYKGRPVDILIIQVYAPTTAAYDEEIE